MNRLTNVFGLMIAGSLLASCGYSENGSGYIEVVGALDACRPSYQRFIDKVSSEGSVDATFTFREIPVSTEPTGMLTGVYLLRSDTMTPASLTSLGFELSASCGNWGRQDVESGKVVDVARLKQIIEVTQTLDEDRFVHLSGNLDTISIYYRSETP